MQNCKSIELVWRVHDRWFISSLSTTAVTRRFLEAPEPFHRWSYHRCNISTTTVWRHNNEDGQVQIWSCWLHGVSECGGCDSACPRQRLVSPTPELTPLLKLCKGRGVTAMFRPLFSPFCNERGSTAAFRDLPCPYVADRNGKRQRQRRGKREKPMQNRGKTGFDNTLERLVCAVCQCWADQTTPMTNIS